MRYISEKPTLAQMKAIVAKDYSLYNIPAYEHYNWCLDYLGSSENRVVEPRLLLPEDAVVSIQEIMIEACSNYLQRVIN